MKVTGITAEFNPLHNGHKYNMSEARRITGADYIVVIMSGDFVQRGGPAICDKYLRTRMALNAGADLVLELPVCYSTSSAEFFASSSAAIFDKLGIIDNMSFGCEYDDISALDTIASILVEEPPEFRSKLKEELRSGRSFPVARTNALYEMGTGIADLSIIMNSPNNILGIEYLKALKKRGSSIRPFAIKRYGSDYRDARFSEINSSALSIRTVLHDCCSYESVRYQLPESSYNILADNFNRTMPVYPNDFSMLLNYRLILESSQSMQNRHALASFTDVSPALADRISRRLNSFSDFDSFCDVLKTKEMTHTRISRALLHILLGMHADTFNEFVGNDFAEYVRVLGFRRDAQPLLKAVKANSSILLLSKLADGKKALSSHALDMFNETNRACEVYNSVVNHKFAAASASEFEKKIEII